MCVCVCVCVCVLCEFSLGGHCLGVFLVFFLVFLDLLFYLFAEIVSRLKVTESRRKEQRCFGGYSHVKHYRFDMNSLSLGEKSK